MPHGLGLGIGLEVGAPRWLRALQAFNPLLLLVAGIGCYTDAAKTIPAGDGDAVYTWSNLGTLGPTADAVQSTAARRPLLDAAAKGVDFQVAQTHFMDLQALTSASTDYTVVLVVDQTTASGAIQSYLGSGGVAGWIAQRTGSTGINDSSGWRTPVVAKTGEQMLSFVTEASGSTTSVYRDGQLLGVDSSYDGTMGWSGPLLGAKPGETQHLNAKIKAILVFDSELSSADLAAVHALLQGEYGVAFDYDSVADLAVAYKSDEGTTGDPVSAWAKALGTGSDFAEATDKPDLGTLGSREALVFDGALEHLDYSGAAGDWNGLHDGTGGTLLLLGAATLGANDIIFSTFGAVATQFGMEIETFTNGTTRLRVGNGTGTFLVNDTTAAVLTANVAACFVFRMETGAADEFDMRVDGAQVGNGAFDVGGAQANDATNVASVASRGAGGSLRWAGKFGDVVRYSRYLNDFEAAAVEAHAAARFAA